MSASSHSWSQWSPPVVSSPLPSPPSGSVTPDPDEPRIMDLPGVDDDNATPPCAPADGTCGPMSGEIFGTDQKGSGTLERKGKGGKGMGGVAQTPASQNGSLPFRDFRYWHQCGNQWIPKEDSISTASETIEKTKSAMVHSEESAAPWVTEDLTSLTIATNFIETWRLDEGCQKILLKLSPEQFQRVITEFQPPTNTKNVNACFRSFLRITFGVSDAVQDRREEFADSWSLDVRSRKRLHQVSHEQLADVIAGFQPPEGTINVSALFCSFLRIKFGVGSILEDRCDEFADKLRLDVRSRKILLQLTPEQLHEVITNFEAPAGTLNASAIFCSFMKIKFGIAAPPNEVAIRFEMFVDKWAIDEKAEPHLWHQLLGFLDKWELNEACGMRLLDLRPEQVQEAIAEFQPPAETRDANSIFLSFLRIKFGLNDTMDYAHHSGATYPVYSKGKGKGAKGLRGFHAEKKIWIGNLPGSVTYKDLEELLKPVGAKRVEVFRGKGTGGAGFATAEEATAAISQFNDHVLNGSKIQVDVWWK